MNQEQDVLNKLLPFQVGHTLQLIECLRIKNRVLDASDTGTGKTYCAIAVAKILNLKPFIICPKSVISNWINIMNMFNVKCLGISNYEMIKNCNYYTENYEPTLCPYIDAVVNKLIDPITLEETSKKTYNFYLPNDCLVIFDEAHRCKNYSSKTSELLLSINKNNIKIMLLSATITDKIDCFKPFGVVFKLYDDLVGYKGWIRKQKTINKIKLSKLSDSDQTLKIIHDSLFPHYGSRLKIKELGGLFPQNNIIAQSYYLDNHNEVEKAYEEINLALQELKTLEDKSEALAKLIRARMKVEMLKVTLFIDLAQEALDNNYSVAIFVNYIDTLDYLCYHMKTSCVIRGGQKIDEREKCRSDFQDNKEKLIIVMCQAGGVGISLHDIHGDHPRMSIISPTWSGQDMKQIFGRIHRAGSKTPAIQKIVYVAKTYEEHICQIIKDKLKNIDAINDGEFNGGEMNVEELEVELNKEINKEIKPKKIYKKKNNKEDNKKLD
jgi:superfamily II DNA or RNA helicase